MYKALTFARAKARQKLGFKNKYWNKILSLVQGNIEQYINMTEKQERVILSLHPITLQNKAAYV